MSAGIKVSPWGCRHLPQKSKYPSTGAEFELALKQAHHVSMILVDSRKFVIVVMAVTRDTSDERIFSRKALAHPGMQSKSVHDIRAENYEFGRVGSSGHVSHGRGGVGGDVGGQQMGSGVIRTGVSLRLVLT